MKPIPGTLVINIGNFLSRWTNDIFKSTTHRVYNVSQQERYSFPLFVGPDYNTKIAPIDTCISKEYPAKYQPFVAGAVSDATFGLPFLLRLLISLALTIVRCLDAQRSKESGCEISFGTDGSVTHTW